MANWPELIMEWDTWQRSVNRPATTRELRRYQLRRLARDFPDPAAITTPELARWLGSNGWSAETMRSYRATLRRFFRWAVIMERLPGDPADALEPITVHAHLARPTPDEVWRRAVMRATPRVRLAILLGAQHALRRGEVARLRREDLRADLAGYSLRVHGKGGRWRDVPLRDDVAALIKACPPGWLFPSPSGGHLTPHHLGKLVSAELGEGWTMHTLRHRCGTTMYRATRDLVAVQSVLGHAKIETTRGYVATDHDAMRAAIDAAA